MAHIDFSKLTPEQRKSWSAALLREAAAPPRYEWLVATLSTAEPVRISRLRVLANEARWRLRAAWRVLRTGETW